MSDSEIVTASVDVSLDPATAFEVFTEEIGRWWRPGPQNWNNRFRAVGIRIEPGVGGRWLEVHDDPEGVFECGRITVWEPPSRFVFLYQDVGTPPSATLWIYAKGLSIGTTIHKPGLTAAQGLELLQALQAQLPPRS